MNRLIRRASPLMLSVALVSASLLIAFALPTPVQAAPTPITCASPG